MDSGERHKKGRAGKGKGDEEVTWVGGVNTIMREVGNGPVEREFRQKQEYHPKQSWTANGKEGELGGQRWCNRCHV